jgi:hypothetical protein
MASKLISTTASELLPRNRLRKSFIVQNEDTVIDCYIKREEPRFTTVSTTDHDHRLARETSLSINSETDGKEAIEDRWTIIAASGTPRISYFETEDIVR